MARVRILGARAARRVDGSWALAALAPGRALAPADLEAAHPEWIACTGPEPVAAALRAAGRWDLDHPRDFDGEDWWYRCRFSSVDSGEPARLRFDGLATIADVWLNAEHILHSDNMFVAQTVDVARQLRPDNELLLRFHALAPLLSSRQPRPRWRTALVSHQSLRWYRTSLLGRMPGWCPPVAPVGPWRPIVLERSPLRAADALVHAALDGDAGEVRVDFRLTCPAGSAVSGTAAVGNSDAPLVCRPFSNDEYAVTAVVRVPGAERWWPHTHGPQPLYDVRACVTVAGVEEIFDLGRVGFRTIEVDRGPDGRGFGLVINGAPVFCRGACWAPLDVARLSADGATYGAAIEQLRTAGMNMVRVGGTMAYEDDAFHDRCDEAGILLWQDLMFASMDYPWHDEAFARSALLEATQVIQAIQSRPSLAVVCGNSEVDQQAAMLGLSAARRSTDDAAEQLASVVHAIAPGTPWVPTTPTGGTFPFQVDTGVSHYYGVGAYRRPFEDARRAGVRFAAECLAFSNVPDRVATDEFQPAKGGVLDNPRWKARVPHDSGADWDFEDVRDHYVEQLFGVVSAVLRARDPERYLALGRVATGEAMLRAFSEWRRPGSTCRGALVWLSRDLWPGAGWGVIDATGRPKAAYWYLKRALAPVALLVIDEGLNGLWIHAVNDTGTAVEGDLRIALYRDGNRLGEAASASVQLPARGHASIHADALFAGFRDLTYAYRFGPPAHDVVAATLRDRATGELLSEACYFPHQLPAGRATDLGLAARVESTAQGYVLVLETNRFAHAVSIDVEGFSPEDNYLHLAPGEARRIGLRATIDGAIPRGRVEALNGCESVPIGIAEPVDAS